MLNSFSAQNFRQFTNLEVPRLGQVNLFVGRNNVGKSALLEALQIYFGRVSGRVLLEVGSTRGEIWDGSLRTVSQVSTGDIIRHLFKGHQLPKPGAAGIVIGPLDDSQIQLSVVAFQRFESPEGFAQLSPVDHKQISLFDDLESDAIPFFVAIEKGRTKRIFATDRPARLSRIQQSGIDEEDVFQIVPTKNLAARKIAAWWDSVNLTDLEEEVVQGLRIINKSIAGIGFVEDNSSSNSRIPLVRVQGQLERLPLSSMGDGVTRLFHIALALVNAKGGALLIDEFENGLHWSIQEKVWQTVFQLAARLNVQIFATTHSRDCVQAFNSAWEQHPEQGAYYRLEGDAEGEIRARPYTLETLSDSIETDVETR